MHIFYTPDITNKYYKLNEQESKHCVSVLRLKIGDRIHLINGKGTYFTADIIDDSPKACVVGVKQKIDLFEKRDYYLHIAIAPPKNINRFEWFVEKATEIGIDEITPIMCENSERRHIKADRLERIIISATKQSVKAYKPVLNDIISFSRFINTKPRTAQKYIAHCINGKREKIKEVCLPGQQSVILIGPEGDFSEKEIHQACSAGYKEITLGNSRLRTETAGIVACHSVAMINS